VSTLLVDNQAFRRSIATSITPKNKSNLFFAPIITSQWSYVNHYLVGTTVKNCCIDLTEIENKYHPRSLYTWEEMNVARDIADMSRGIMTPEGLLSGDLYGLAEALYVVMHFLSIGYI
jgi:hypothetical protein